MDFQLLFLGRLEVRLSRRNYLNSSLTLFLGLLATAIIKMDGIGGLAGWRWIFILEGIATVLLSIVTAFFLPADILSASFLTEEERIFARRKFSFEPAIYDRH